jgi:uncharacterized membrane protein YdjX (TVP38/TMEM64 family)
VSTNATESVSAADEPLSHAYGVRQVSLQAVDALQDGKERMAFESEFQIVLPDPTPLWRRIVASRGLQLAFMVIALGGIGWSWAESYGSLDAIRQELGLQAAALAVVIQAVIAVSPFPDEVIGFGNSVIYGFTLGAILNWCAWMLGSFLEYGLAWRSARDLEIEPARLQSRLGRLNRRFAPDHPMFLILVRLVPIGGGHIVNTSAGVLGVPLWRFAWTGAIGMIPGSIVIAGAANKLVGFFS